MYQVIINLFIWSDENRLGSYAQLTRSLSLPFVPFIGLKLSEEGWYCRPIVDVVWDNETKTFHCSVEDEFPYEIPAKPGSNTEKVSYEDLVKSRQQLGWELKAKT